MLNQEEKKVNKLTEAERERLDLVAEECAEVIQKIGKILRFGYDGVNPYKPGRGKNRTQLEMEIGDLTASMFLMSQANDIKTENILFMATNKLKTMEPFVFYNKDILVKAVKNLEQKRDVYILNQEESFSDEDRGIEYKKAIGDTIKYIDRVIQHKEEGLRKFSEIISRDTPGATLNYYNYITLKIELSLMNTIRSEIMSIPESVI